MGSSVLVGQVLVDNLRRKINIVFLCNVRPESIY